MAERSKRPPPAMLGGIGKLDCVALEGIWPVGLSGVCIPVLCVVVGLYVSCELRRKPVSITCWRSDDDS